MKFNNIPRIMPSRFEYSDWLVISGLLLLYSEVFLLILVKFYDCSSANYWQLFRWIIGIEKICLISYPSRWIFLILVLLLFSCYVFLGPKIRRNIQKKFPKLGEFIKKFLEHFSPLPSFITFLFKKEQTKFEDIARLPLVAMFPSSEKDKKPANDLYQDWHKLDTPSYPVIMRWHRINYFTEGVIRDRDNSFIGCYDFFPVQSTFVEELKKGNINEFELEKYLIEDHGSGESLRTTEHIYIGGIVRLKTFNIDKMKEEKNTSYLSYLGEFICYAMIENLYYVFNELRSRENKLTFHVVAYEEQGVKLSRMAQKGNFKVRGWVTIDEDKKKGIWIDLNTNNAIYEFNNLTKSQKISKIKELRVKGIYPWFEFKVDDLFSKHIKELRTIFKKTLPDGGKGVTIHKKNNGSIGFEVRWKQVEKKWLWF